jgi:prophage maintenance system killer protein
VAIRAASGRVVRCGYFGQCAGATATAFAHGEEDVVVLAVQLLAGIAQAHAFGQGNQRTSFGAMVEFLIMNGYALAIEDSSSRADAVIELVEHRSSEEDIVHAVRPFVVANV